MPDYMGVGLGRHPALQHLFPENPSSLPSYYQPMFYDGGTYDTGAHAFAVGASNPTNPAFISLGPDWRQTTIFGDYDYMYLWDFGQETQIFHAGAVSQRELATYRTNGDPFSRDCAAPYQILVYQNDALGHATNIALLDTNTGVAWTVYEADYRTTNGSTVLPGICCCRKRTRTGSSRSINMTP